MLFEEQDRAREEVPTAENIQKSMGESCADVARIWSRRELSVSNLRRFITVLRCRANLYLPIIHINF